MQNGSQSQSIRRWASGDPLGQGHLNEPVDVLNALLQGRPRTPFMSSFHAIVTKGADTAGRYSWVEAVWDPTATPPAWIERPAASGGLWGLCDGDSKALGAITVNGPVDEARECNGDKYILPGATQRAVRMTRVIDIAGNALFFFSWGILPPGNADYQTLNWDDTAGEWVPGPHRVMVVPVA